MNVVIVPCLFDNYAYLTVDESRGQAVIVDPCEGPPILRKLDSMGLEPSGVLCTHHHADHVGGLSEILERHPDVPVFAHERDQDRIEGLTRTISHEDEVTLGGLHFRALHVPGHTLGAVTWLCDDAAFTGDALFVGGCGRVFEGTARMMYRSLHEVVGRLDPQTRVFCGHEYTLTNLRFAQHVEPSNTAVATKLARAEALRNDREPTIPSSLEEERATNPFMRCSESGVVDFARERDAGGVDPVSVFAAVRAAKDRFRG